MTQIKQVKAREILDSRGKPTIEAEIILTDGSMGRGIAPSGASTGKFEAFELRDHDPKRYQGFGVSKAVSNVNHIIASAIIGQDVFNQEKLDQTLIELDGSDNKSNLGSNAILAVSIAASRAACKSLNIKLFQYLKKFFANQSLLMPKPLINIINGGKHADNNLAVQEFIIIPIYSNLIAENLRISSEVFQVLKEDLKKAFFATNVGDEGGFAPAFNHTRYALDFISNAIEKLGFKIGTDFILGLDCAANEFFNNEQYHIDQKTLSKEHYQQYLIELIKQYSIFYLEDPFAEDDLSNWQDLTRAFNKNLLIVGDDLFVTNPKLLQKGVDDNLANSILIKPNQIGSITETISTIKLAQKANFEHIISHRSGESEDDFIAHLAVAANAKYIKAGSVTRSERLVKYNELIRIQEFF